MIENMTATDGPHNAPMREIPDEETVRRIPSDLNVGSSGGIPAVPLPATETVESMDSNLTDATEEVAPPADMDAVTSALAPDQTTPAQHYIASADRSEFADTVKRIEPDAWKFAGVHAGLALAGAFLAALLTTVMFLVAVSFGDSSDIPEGLSSNWFTISIQLMGMGLLNSLRATGELDTGILGSYSSTVTVFIVPLVVVLGAVLAVRLGGKKLSPRAQQLAGAQRWVVALSGGVAFALASLLLTSVFGYTIGEDLLEGSGFGVVKAGSVGGFLFSVALVSLIIFSEVGATWLARVPILWRSAFRTAAEHLLVLAAIAGLSVWIALIVEADGQREMPLLLFPILLPFAATNGALFLSGGTIGASGTADVAFGASSGDGFGFTMFSADLPLWCRILAPIVAIFALLVASLRWRVRTKAEERSASEWFTLPIAYFGVGAIFTIVSTAAIQSSGSLEAFASVRGTAGPQNWTPFVVAFVGLLVVLSSKYLFAPMVGLLPSGLTKRLVARLHEQSPKFVGDASSVNTAPVTDAQRAAANIQVDGTGSANTSAPPTQQELPVEQIRSTQDFLSSTEPMNPKTKKKIVLGISTVVGLGVFAIAVTFAYGKLSETVFGPQKLVEDYLNALVEGEAEKAVALSSPNVRSAQRVLLTDDVYKASDNRPTDYSITDVQLKDESAVVTTRITQDGQEYPLTFEVAREGKQALIFDDWKMGYTQWATLEIGAVTELSEVNGVAITLPGREVLDAQEVPAGLHFDDEEYLGGDFGESGSENSVALLPGRYVFKAPQASKYLEFGQDIVVDVPPEQYGQIATSYVHFESYYTESLFQDSTKIVNDALQKCLGSESLIVDGCEIANYEDQYWEAMTGISRSWSQTPVLVVVDSEGNRATSGEEVDYLAGEDLSVQIDSATIDVDYKVRDDAEDEWIDRNTTLYPFTEDYSPLQLPITIDGEKLTVDLSALEVAPDDWRKDRD